MTITRVLLGVAILLCVPAMSEAAFRIYLVPQVGTGGPADPMRPKYFTEGLFATTAWSGVSYGSEAWIFVGADLSAADDALLVSKPDGFALPYDLSTTLTAGQVTAVQNKLDAIKAPSQWVTTALTWKQVLRTVLGLSMVMQRFQGSLFAGGVTLNTTIGALPAAARNKLIAAARDLDVNTSGITGATTVRQALRIVGEQVRERPTTVFEFNHEQR